MRAHSAATTLVVLLALVRFAPKLPGFLIALAVGGGLSWFMDGAEVSVMLIGELPAILQALGDPRARLGEPDLQRVPNGFPKDHPQADLLRHKGLAAWIDHDEPCVANNPHVMANCLDDFKTLKPLFDWLSH